MTGSLLNTFRDNSWGTRHHIDVEAIKASNPIESVVAAYGIELHRTGRALRGRCPLHEDHGRPNFYAWADSSSWWCFRCNLGGDVIRFIQLVDQVDFIEALSRLGAGISPSEARPAAPPTTRKTRTIIPPDPDVEAQRVLDAASSLYHRRLLGDARALAYVEQRGIDRATINQCKVGYAAGDEFLAYLKWRSLPLGPALRLGLLDAAGREFLAGRIVLPDQDLRSRVSAWMIGRLFDTPANQDPADGAPKYLGLPTPKPLFGSGTAHGSPSVVVCEGAFDYLVLRTWGYPAVALMGTHANASVLEQLRGFPRLYVALDQDDAGVEGMLRLANEIGPSVVPVALPDGIKDVGELGIQPDGHRLFAQALLEASGSECGPDEQAA